MSNSIGDLYRKAVGALRGRPTNFSWLLPNRLAGCGRPSSEREVEWLRRQGVAAILSLTEGELPQQWIVAQGLAYTHVPIPNHTAPSPETLDAAVAFLRTQINAVQPVAVHCAAGQGRTGTVLAAYLVAEGHRPDEAIQEVRRKRPGSIENPFEVQAVHVYGQWLQRKRS